MSPSSLPRRARPSGDFPSSGMCLPATGLPVSQGLQIGDLYTLAGLTAYVVPPRDPATYDGRALVLLPDMTGVANVHNRILAGGFSRLSAGYLPGSQVFMRPASRHAPLGAMMPGAPPAGG